MNEKKKYSYSYSAQENKEIKRIREKYTEPSERETKLEQLHRLDARTKIILTVVFIVSIFLCQNFWSLGLMVLFTLQTVAISRVPLKMVLKSIKPIAIIVIFTSIINIFYIKEERVFFIWSLVSTPGCGDGHSIGQIRAGGHRPHQGPLCSPGP